MFCNAIFGLFCLALPIGTTTASMDNMGFGGAVSVTASGWSANLGMGTDAFVPLNPTRLAKLCDEAGACIRYWRHCAPSKGQKMVCDFSFDENYTSIGVSIYADTTNDMDRALSSVGYLRDRKKPDAAIPLSLLKEESRFDQLPECLYSPDRKPDEGCPTTQPGPL